MSARNSNVSDHVILYVKSGWQGEGYGACPICQRFYMVLDIKSKGKALTYDIITVNTARPSQEFRKFANRLPVLKHGDEVIMDTEEIQQYLDSNFPVPDLQYDNREAHTACIDIFSKFSFFIKNVSHTADPLLKELMHLDMYLKHSGKQFLCGNEMTHLDCNVLPKLQHVRVASQAFKNFTIPPSLSGLWRYLGNAYHDDTFKKTCPSDQEIVLHWKDKREITPLPAEKQKMYCIDHQAPIFSLSLPKFLNGH